MAIYKEILVHKYKYILNSFTWSDELYFTVDPSQYKYIYSIFVSIKKIQAVNNIVGDTNTHQEFSWSKGLFAVYIIAMTKGRAISILIREVL